MRLPSVGCVCSVVWFGEVWFGDVRTVWCGVVLCDAHVMYCSVHCIVHCMFCVTTIPTHIHTYSMYVHQQAACAWERHVC